MKKMYGFLLCALVVCGLFPSAPVCAGGAGKAVAIAHQDEEQRHSTIDPLTIVTDHGNERTDPAESKRSYPLREDPAPVQPDVYQSNIAAMALDPVSVLSVQTSIALQQQKNEISESPPHYVDLTAANHPSKTIAALAPSSNLFQARDEVEQRRYVDFIKELTGSRDTITLDASGHASEATINTAVSLDEAVAFALKNNFEVLASDEKTRGAYWDKMGAYAQYVPSVDLSYATGMERSQPASYNAENGDRVLDSRHHRYDKNIVVRQPLIDLGIVADVLSSHDKEQITKADRRVVHETVASDTVSVFLKLIQARIAIGLADQYKRYLDDLSQRMEARVTGGGAASADLDRIRGRSAMAESAHIEALGDYESNLADFKRLTKILPIQLRVPESIVAAVPTEADDAIRQALLKNPDYQSSLRKIDLAADDRNKALTGIMPKLSVQYAKAFSYDAGGAAHGNPIDGVYPTQQTESVMLVAQWSLGGGVPATTAMAGAAKRREMLLRADDARVRLEQGVRTAYTAIHAAQSRISILWKSAEANKRVVDGFEAQYKNGERSLFDVLDAYEQLYVTRLNLMRVMIAQAQASYQIKTLMGETIASVLATRQE